MGKGTAGTHCPPPASSQPGWRAGSCGCGSGSSSVEASQVPPPLPTLLRCRRTRRPPRTGRSDLPPVPVQAKTGVRGQLCLFWRGGELGRSSYRAVESMGPQLSPPSLSQLTQSMGWANKVPRKYTAPLTSLGFPFPISTMEKLFRTVCRILTRLHELDFSCVSTLMDW